MKVRPLHDRILVKRIEEEKKTQGRDLHPGQRQGEAAGGARRRRRHRQGARQRQDAGPRSEQGRPGAVQQVLRLRSPDRRRRAPDHPRGRRPRGARVGGENDGCQGDPFPPGCSREDPARRQHAGQRGPRDARPEGPQRPDREELGLAHGHQGRRHRRQGDRALRQVREHGRADGEARSPRRPPTSRATAPPPRPCSPRPSSARAASSSRPATTRWT